MRLILVFCLILSLLACSKQTPKTDASPTPVTAVNKHLAEAQEALDSENYKLAIEKGEAALEKEKDKESEAALAIREILVDAYLKKRDLMSGYTHLAVLIKKSKNPKFKAMGKAMEAQLWAEVFFPRIIESRELAAMGEVTKARQILAEIQDSCLLLEIDSTRVDQEIHKLPQ